MIVLLVLHPARMHGIYLLMCSLDDCELFIITIVQDNIVVRVNSKFVAIHTNYYVSMIIVMIIIVVLTRS